MQGEFCEPCDPRAAFANWPRARLGGVLFIVVVAFIVVTVVWLLGPVLPLRSQRRASAAAAGADEQPHGSCLPSGKVAGEVVPGRAGLAAAAAAHRRRAGRLARVVAFVGVPQRLVVENLQIISSFRRTMRLSWPKTFARIVDRRARRADAAPDSAQQASRRPAAARARRLRLLNFNFLALPKTACATPSSNFYARLNGITVSVAGFALYMGALWAAGRLVARARRLSHSAVRDFDRRSLAKLVAFLTFACAPAAAPPQPRPCRAASSASYPLTPAPLHRYAPVTETVLSTFSCRRIGDGWYLREETETQCYTAEYNRYARLSIFWALFYVAGVPALYAALLWYYGVVAVARELVRNAALRALIGFARSKRVALPDAATVTVASIAREDVDALYAAVIAPPPARDERDEAPLKAPLESADAADREAKLAALLRFSSQRLRSVEVTWAEAAGDPRLAGARASIESLYGEFSPKRWYWSLVEIVNKLVITGAPAAPTQRPQPQRAPPPPAQRGAARAGVLGFIAPGQQAQVVAGLGLTFLMLLAYLTYPPYLENAYSTIGLAAAIELVLFFAFALMLKAGVKVTPNDDLFYGACVGVLMCSVFTFPVLVVLRRLRWPLEEEEEEEEEEANGAGDAKVHHHTAAGQHEHAGAADGLAVVAEAPSTVA